MNTKSDLKERYPEVYKVIATSDEITFDEYFQYLQWCVNNNKVHTEDVIGRIRSDQ